VAEFLLKLAISAGVAVVVSLLDGPLFDVTMPWWLCAGIGLVIVFGGVLIIHTVDDW
jgi:hypothetical protein